MPSTCRSRIDSCNFSHLNQVIVRMRPPTKDEEEGEVVVQKISNDSLSIAGHTFTFDSIADTQSTQVKNNNLLTYACKRK